MENKFLSNWIVRNLLIAVGIVVVLGFGSSLLLKQCTHHGEEFAVPDFSGMTPSQAERLARRHDLRVEVVDSIYVKRQKRGSVVRQDPHCSSAVKKGRRIQLTINAVNPKQIAMPNLIGYSLRSARAELSARGLELGRLIYVNDIATNNVLRQIHANAEIEPDTMISSEERIDLVLGLSRNDNLTTVPDLAGEKYKAALDRIADFSLNVGKVVFDRNIRSFEDSLAAVVYNQYPEPLFSDAKKGQSVNIYLTLDHSKVPVRKDATAEN